MAKMWPDSLESFERCNMKRFFLLIGVVVLVVAGVWLLRPPSRVLAQVVYEVACPQGSDPLPFGKTSNPITNKFRAFLCVDPSGKVAIQPEVLSVGTSIAGDGGGFKHKRNTSFSVPAASNQAVTIVWTTAFPDAFYSVNCSVQDATTGTSALRVHHIETWSASSVTVRLVNDDGVSSHGGTLICVAAHD